MRRDRAGRALFERAVTIHRQGCEALAEPGRFVASAVEAPAPDAPPDRVVAYRVGAGIAYDAFRRLIGQLAGLLILVQASGRREVLDLPDLRIAGERWREAGEALAALAAPGRLAAHKAKLDAAWRHIGACLQDVERFGETGGGAAALASASDRIRAAHRALKGASDADAGLAMVDFRQACCTCVPARTSR